VLVLVNPIRAEESTAESATDEATEHAPAPRLTAVRSSETARAAGLAAAAMAANMVAVAFTVIFTRVLGADSYGSLAALINLTVILLVPGSALQVAAAREGAVGRLGRGAELSATLAGWTRQLLVILVGVSAVSVLARQPLADVLNVSETWAAAAVPATGALWLLLSLERGLLQAARAYRVVGLSIVLEATGRLVVGLAMVGALGVTGAYLGTFFSIAIAAAVLAVVLRRRLGPPAARTERHPLTALARDAAVPITVLTLVAAIQNIDVIVARHVLSEHTAGVYSAAVVAAKALVWIAVGLGMWVVPEASRHAAAGRDPRPVLIRALAVIAAAAVVALTLYAAAPRLVLNVAFGKEYESADSVLFALGAAYALLALTYLAAQFLLGLRRWRFAAVLAVAALLEPMLLLATGNDLGSFATVVLAVQSATAAVLLILAGRVRRA
jgi:O-antigen/teichoic acid export membrane protein